MFDIVRIAAVVVALAVLRAGDALTARGASPSPGRFPTGGLLVFSGSCGCRVGEGLYTIRPDGTRLRFLRNGIGTDHPRWSPDGRWIATDKSSEIVLVAADNSGAEREVTRPPDLKAGGADSDPSWAPDGKRLVFVRAGADSSVPAAIWSADVNGRAAREVFPAASFVSPQVSPEFSPDGRRLVFNGATRLWITNLHGSDLQPVGPPDHQGGDPRWSPDGRHIAYLEPTPTSYRLDILDLRTGQLHIVPASGPGAFAWSPDGHWLALARSANYPCNDPTSNNTCTRTSLWIVNATDNHQRRIMPLGDGGISGIDWRR